MSVPLVAAITVTLLASFAIWKFGQSVDQKRVRRFDERESLPLPARWSRFEVEDRISSTCLEEALRLVEGATGVSIQKLAPEDRFTDELIAAKGWEFDDGLAELRWALEARGVTSVAEVMTVGDFVKAFAGSGELTDPCEAAECD